MQEFNARTMKTSNELKTKKNNKKKKQLAANLTQQDIFFEQLNA